MADPPASAMTPIPGPSQTRRNHGSLLGVTSLGVAIEEVLYDARMTPLARDDFNEFLVGIAAEENLAFWLESQKMYQRIEDDKPLVRGKRAELPLDDVDPELGGDPPKWARLVVEHWIDEKTSTTPINISGAMRSEIIGKTAQGAVPDLRPAQKEVVAMLRLPFQEFVQRQLRMNLDFEERVRRFRMSAAAFVLTVMFGLLLRYLAVPADPGLPRWGVFLVLLPFGGTAGYMLVSAKMGV